MTLVEECIAAYGGLERWRAAEAVELRVWARGLAFASIGRRELIPPTRARVMTTGQRVEFADWPRAGETGVFTSEGCRIGGDERAEPRYGLRWDDLDALAFAGAALWTYVSLPFVLADWGADELPGRRLRFRVPEPVRSHCREQTVYVDDRGLIVRHHYTAEAFGRWARSVHRSHDFETSDGLPVPAHRRVRPRPFGPVIVRVDMADAAYVPRSG